MSNAIDFHSLYRGMQQCHGITKFYEEFSRIKFCHNIKPIYEGRKCLEAHDLQLHHFIYIKGFQHCEQVNAYEINCVALM